MLSPLADKSDDMGLMLMAENITSVLPDPDTPDWAALELAPTWADELRLYTPRGLWRFMRAILGTPQQVQVDTKQPLFSGIPRYALQEFHSLPNGNYSHKVSHGYITGFDIAMLGQVQKVRAMMAERVAGCGSVLDLGTAGGKLAGTVKATGVSDVWGVDVSPYLLKHAASNYPQIKFLHTTAENLPFASERFEAVVVCFLFHEMPPKYIKRALASCYRVLKPGGQLLI
ncbi:MAG TPA: class I SAM-dependent methyltransferase, partial [Cellvibrionaceae bacterium]